MLADMRFALQHATQHHCIVVVVVPQSRHDEAMTHLLALAGADTPFSGRMMSAGVGGRLIVHPVTALTVTTAFDVMFTGWGGREVEGTEEMERWRQAAKQVVTRVA